jgi:hypothetical protein
MIASEVDPSQRKAALCDGHVTLRMLKETARSLLNGDRAVTEIL